VTRILAREEAVPMNGSFVDCDDSEEVSGARARVDGLCVVSETRRTSNSGA